jgi:hypothetical protein
MGTTIVMRGEFSMLLIKIQPGLIGARGGVTKFDQSIEDLQSEGDADESCRRNQWVEAGSVGDRVTGKTAVKESGEKLLSQEAAKLEKSGYRLREFPEGFRSRRSRTSHLMRSLRKRMRITHRTLLS